MYVKIEKNTEVGQHAIKPLNLDLFLSLFDIFIFSFSAYVQDLVVILSFTVEATIPDRDKQKWASIVFLLILINDSPL
jgi:hypothetical protein